MNMYQLGTSANFFKNNIQIILTSSFNALFIIIIIINLIYFELLIDCMG